MKKVDLNTDPAGNVFYLWSRVSDRKRTFATLNKFNSQKMWGGSREKRAHNRTDRLLSRDPDCDDGGGSVGRHGLRRGLRRPDHRGQAGQHERRAEEGAVPQRVGGTRRQTRLMNGQTQSVRCMGLKMLL